LSQEKIDLVKQIDSLQANLSDAAKQRETELLANIEQLKLENENTRQHLKALNSEKESLENEKNSLKNDSTVREVLDQVIKFDFVYDFISELCCFFLFPSLSKN
jgi:hypothetical protein